MKNTKKRKRKQFKQIGIKEKVFIGIFLIALIIFTAARVNSYLYSYEGLGDQWVISMNPYINSAFGIDENGRLKYEDENYVSLCGIDVSSYQKEVDWEKVKADGIDFAIIRLGYRGYSEGVIKEDPMFETYVEGAKKAGLEVGVYFFSQAITVDEAIEEAKYVVKVLRDKNITYPVVFDMEPVADGQRIGTLTMEEKTAIADAFCQVIKKRGYTPMIYGNPTWLLGDIDLTYLTEYDIWLAHYTILTDFAYQYTMWQYTDCGDVDGIQDPVDIDIWMQAKKQDFS